MNVVLACEIFPPDIGGPATYALQLAEALLKSGHSVKIITYGEVKSEFRFPVMYVSRRIPFLLRQFFYFLQLLRISRGADIVYAQGPSVGPAAILVLRATRYQEKHDRSKSDTSNKKDSRSQKKIPVVIKFVGDQSWQQVRMRGSKVGFEDYMRAYGKRWWGVKIWFIQRWQKFSLQNADHVIVPSQYLKKIVTQYFGAVDDKVRVIPNGVEVRTEILHNQRHCEEGFANEAISGNACINEIATLPTVARNDILFVGRFENWKGLDTLIDALKLLPRDFTLTLVGDGSERENLESRIKNQELEDRVKLTSRIPHSELEKYFSRVLCLVEGSQYEGMPHVVLEAWSFGVPVVVSNFPANMELVKDGETGLVFTEGDAKDLADKILLLASNQTLYERISISAFEEHKKYDKNKVMERTIGLLVSRISSSQTQISGSRNKNKK